MSEPAVHAREWWLLASATLIIMTLLALAASMPTVCSGVGSCLPTGRLAPAAFGAVIVAVTALATALIAQRSAGVVSDGVHRSEGVIAAGALIICFAGIGFAALAVVSAGFMLPPFPG